MFEYARRSGATKARKKTPQETRRNGYVSRETYPCMVSRETTVPAKTGRKTAHHTHQTNSVEPEKHAAGPRRSCGQMHLRLNRGERRCPRRKAHSGARAAFPYCKRKDRLPAGTIRPRFFQSFRHICKHIFASTFPRNDGNVFGVLRCRYGLFFWRKDSFCKKTPVPVFP